MGKVLWYQKSIWPILHLNHIKLLKTNILQLRLPFNCERPKEIYLDYHLDIKSERERRALDFGKKENLCKERFVGRKNVICNRRSLYSLPLPPSLSLSLSLSPNTSFMYLIQIFLFYFSHYLLNTYLIMCTIFFFYWTCPCLNIFILYIMN